MLKTIVNTVWLELAHPLTDFLNIDTNSKNMFFTKKEKNYHQTY